MKPPPFEYERPESVDEAVALLEHGGEDAKVLAGGQSLVPMLAFRLARPTLLVDVNALPLAAAGAAGGVVTIGATARQREVERMRLPLLSEALSQVAHPAIRNRGTVVGSLCHADPAAELPAAALLLDGVLEVLSRRGTRLVPVEQLLAGPLTTTLAPDELAVSLRLHPPVGWRWRVLEVSRRAGDFALVGVAAGVAPDGAAGRLAVFGAAPRAYRVDGPVADLPGLAAERAEPVADIHAEAGYRRHLVEVLSRRALAA